MERPGGWRQPPFVDWRRPMMPRDGGQWNCNNRFFPPPNFDPRFPPRYSPPTFDRSSFQRPPNAGHDGFLPQHSLRGGWARGRGGSGRSDIGGRTNDAPEEFSSKRGHGHFGRGGGSYRGGGKRPRIDKRDLPENNQFSCDTCDRGFKTADKLQEHISEHVKCSAAGCNYVAAAKLVQMHFDFQHRTGVAKKIWQLESKKDIDNWVLERKKNFPTAQNIVRKKQEITERRERGEVLEDREFGKMRGRGRGRGHRGRGGFTRGQGRGRGYGNRNQHMAANSECDSKLETENASADTGSKCPMEKKLLPDEDPLALLLRDDQNNCSNSRTSPVHSEGATKAPGMQLGGALGSLVSAYTNSDEDDDKDAAAKVKVSPIKVKPVTLIPKARLTLLEKLLGPAIRHERNVLFQCIRYITQNNFFDDKPVVVASSTELAPAPTSITDSDQPVAASTDAVNQTVVDDEIWDDV
jgi:hypothetical protein